MITKVFSLIRESHVYCASLLILLWSYTALDKLFNHSEFYSSLERQYFPQSFVLTLSWAIPVAELGIVLLLLKKDWRKTGVIVSAILLSIFTTYIALAVFGFRDKMPCSCGGVISALGWKMHLLFNLFFLGLSIIGVHTIPKKKGGAVTTA